MATAHEKAEWAREVRKSDAFRMLCDDINMQAAALFISSPHDMNAVEQARQSVLMVQRFNAELDTRIVDHDMEVRRIDRQHR